MTAATFVPVIAAPACVIYLVITRRSIRAMRAGDEEWRWRWRQLDLARRKSIRGYMKRGEAVPDREDAELAVRATAQLEHVRKAAAPMLLFSQLYVCVFLVAGAVSGSTVLIIIGAFGLGSSAVFGLLARRQRHRYQQSEAATRRVHKFDQPLPG